MNLIERLRSKALLSSAWIFWILIILSLTRSQNSKESLVFAGQMNYIVTVNTHDGAKMTIDKTAAQRQRKRYARLAVQNIKRKSLLVHDECSRAFEQLRFLFEDAENAKVLERAAKSIVDKKPVNVSKVKQLSPFRYPGGKTWLVPEVRQWLAKLDFRPSLFIEPFAGGGITSLTVAVENLAEKVVMAELDPDVASVWQTIFNEPDYLCEQILDFRITLDNVKRLLNAEPKTLRERAFRTIVKNRTQRGGIIAPGASLVKSGENGKGLSSRWYPETLVKRIKIISSCHDKIEFVETNAFDVIEKYKKYRDAIFFIDPPYTAGGKKAGKRLYRFNEIDHYVLFKKMAEVRGKFLMTYDDTNEAKYLASAQGFVIEKVPMKNTHHAVIYELLITKA
ncbi:MAG: DNA adenine methylase [bacterium]